MASPQQTEAVTQQNPFLEQPEIQQWDSRVQVANSKVLNHIRRKIANLKFWIDHPLVDEPYQPDVLERLNHELDHWNLMLIKAHYN